jgi:hypothetical protein
MTAEPALGLKSRIRHWDEIQTIVLRRITELVSPFPDSHFSLRSYESLVSNVYVALAP